MATDAERDLFESAVLAGVGRQAERLPASEITGFLAMAGRAYDRRLMVMGRAVNGWGEGILPAAVATTDAATRYARRVQDSVAPGPNGECPMRWVTDSWGAPCGEYNTKRSAFWRAVRGVVARVGMADVEQPEWPSQLVWSNLYKVSPACRGNPSGGLRQIQLPGCLELLRLEVVTYGPRHLLLLTGNDWAAPFLAAIGCSVHGGTGLSYVEWFGTCSLGGGHQMRCVVAAHPQGKPSAQWLQEVLLALQ